MKKYLLFIVEGKNDKREIQAMLRASCPLFKDRFVDAYVVCNRDITTDKDSDTKTIMGKLNRLVISWRKGETTPHQKVSTSDVSEIIHVVDIDGAFIPPSSIIEADTGQFQYCETTIECYNKGDAVGRNRKKARVLRKMLEIRCVDNIPYSVYYASCNMDHVLFNDRNLTPEEKRRMSEEFAVRCTSREDLNDSIFGDGLCAGGTYEESWEMIQQEHNSLARHTNLNLLLESDYLG